MSVDRRRSRFSYIAAAILAAFSLPFLLLAILGFEDWLLRTNVTESVYRRVGIWEPLKAFFEALLYLVGSGR